MALESIRLDDLTWNEMVVAIRRRIAAASAGDWTLHAPVDPGITMLELFAYLLEQRVYWMDQVPDSLVRGALALLGEQPRPTQSAATVMHFPEDKVPVLPAATRLTLDRSIPPLIFSTKSEVALLPFRTSGTRISLFINGADRTADLDHGKVMRLFPATGSGEVKIAFWLREPLPGSLKNKCFSMLFDLRDPRGIAAQWVPQWSREPQAPVSPPAKISWFFSGANNSRIQFAADEVNDGTGGLRRSGVVSLPIRKDAGDQIEWQPESSDVAQQLYVYAIWMRVEEATFSAPPRLERLIPNVAIASHTRETEAYQLLQRDFLPLPGNTITLADLPNGALIKDHPPIENTIKLEIREADTNWHTWEPTLDLSFHGPSDRVFITDRLLGKVHFGDGLTGRLPVLMTDGKPQLKLQYSVGGGKAGNLGASLNWNAVPANSNVRLTAVNLVQTEGGEEPETMAAARQRAATELRKRTRAVIREDYEEIAKNIPGIAIKRAHAAIGLHPDHPCVPIPGAVTVFVVPDVSRPDILSEDSLEFDDELVESAFVAAPVPDPGALSLVQAKLETVRLAGSEVFVLGPHYEPVDLTLDIETNSAATIELNQKIKRRLRSFLDPLIGGDAGDGWPFGEPLRPSAIRREVQTALGEDGLISQLFIRLPNAPNPPKKIPPCPDPLGSDCAGDRQVKASDDEQNETTADDPTCADVLIGAHSLVELRRLSVNFHRGAANTGGLR